MADRTPRVGVVMAGGHGERFWPLSRPERPKQLLKLTDSGRSMLEDAVERLLPLVEAIYVSTSGPLADAIRPTGLVCKENIFAEPGRRSTLGALTWSTANLMARGLGHATVAVVTADHAIGAEERFRSAAQAAMELAEESGGVVTLGIRPSRAETGYGYIEIDQNHTIALTSGWVAHRSTAFREKPDEVTAAVYMTTGLHLWNTGMFFYTVPEFLRELEAAAPEAHAICRAIATALQLEDKQEAERQFLLLPDTSIDYAVMERAERMHVIPVDFPWDDVGAWDALERTMTADENGNIIMGSATTVDTTTSIVVNDDMARPVALLGVKDLVVVTTHNAVLVCHKSQAQRVKQIVRLVAEQERGVTPETPLPVDLG